MGHEPVHVLPDYDKIEVMPESQIIYDGLKIEMPVPSNTDQFEKPKGGI